MNTAASPAQQQQATNAVASPLQQQHTANTVASPAQQQTQGQNTMRSTVAQMLTPAQRQLLGPRQCVLVLNRVNGPIVRTQPVNNSTTPTIPLRRSKRNQASTQPLTNIALPAKRKRLR